MFDSLLEPVEQALKEVKRLRRTLAKGTNRQVRSAAERDNAKASAFAWFKSHKPALPQGTITDDVDASYRTLLELADTNATRKRYLATLKALEKSLAAARTRFLVRPPEPADQDEAPDFSRLIADPAMRSILVARWGETQRCVAGGAPLAATVMMGGILEGLLIARANRLTDKSPMFKTKSAPKGKDGKPKPLQEWMLRDYTEVAHELGWIRRSAKDIGIVVRDYRNYIHPAKQLSHGVQISEQDARLFWAVFAELSKQIIDWA